jgi:hypothetical protein
MCVAGLGVVPSGLGVGGRAVAALGGGFVAVSGFAARVTEVTATRVGLRIRYRARRSLEVRWGSMLALVPPRWPGGCWRLVATSCSRSLMASDVVGLEGVLREVVRNAGLRFDPPTRRWVADAAPNGTQPGPPT